LRRCLAAIVAQRRAPDEIVVVARVDDAESRAALAEFGARVRCVDVAGPGVVNALNAGIDAVTGDVIAITDDDAAPRLDWLERIAAIFAADPRVGGVGGRDWVHHGMRTEHGSRATVGKLQWYGRCIGNHHLGAGGPRAVDFLKGVNMSFRRAAIGDVRFDARLRGDGAQVCNDMAFSLAIRRRGWQLVYDPLVAVDHYPGERFDDDRRLAPLPSALRNAAFNEALVVSEDLGRAYSWLFCAWALAVGTRSAPGLLQVLRLYWPERARAIERVRAAMAGTFEGWRAAAR
jgi:cellulose synthase/poly-beta-1,6-N-acetylglucosamine synthase-like glycosyltransferase